MRTLATPALLLAVLALATAPARAQQYTGTFTVATNDGGTLSVALRQAPDGTVSGRLTSTQLDFRMEGALEDGTVVGTMTSPEGFTEDHPQVREWIQFLAGNKLTRMSSYSSGSSGGYSARVDVYLCSDHSFAMRDESSVSVDVGGASGSSGGVGTAQGQWYVITNGQVVGLILEPRGGEPLQLRMDHQNGATFADGERVYVTPAEVCR